MADSTGISLDAIFNDALNGAKKAGEMYNQAQQTFTSATTSRRDIGASNNPNVTWGNPVANDPTQWAAANAAPPPAYGSYAPTIQPVNYGYGYGNNGGVYNNGFSQAQPDDAGAGFTSQTYGKVGGY